MSDDSGKQIDKSICPVCKASNQCAMAKATILETGTSIQDCWCMSVDRPNNKADKIPKSEWGEVCLCLECLLRY